MKSFSLFLFTLTFLTSQMFSINDQIKLDEFQKYGMTVVLLCDTSNPKTRKCHLADLKRMKETFKNIAAQCNVPLRLWSYKAKKFDFDKIKKLLRQNYAEYARTSIFYYTGEDASITEKKRSWPQVKLSCTQPKRPHNAYLGSPQNIGYNIDHFAWSAINKSKSGVDVECFTQILHEYCSAFFTVSLFDCYDRIIRPQASDFDFLKLSFKDGGQKKAFEYLFAGPQNRLLAASHQRGFPGYGIAHGKNRGGLFTLLLCRSLNKSADTPLLWETVLQEVKSGCFSFKRNTSQKCRQKIFVDIKHFTPPFSPYKIKE